jgi:hypothetical protein
MPLPLLALGAIMAGGSLLESILGQIFKKKQSKDVKAFQRETTAKGRGLLADPGFDEATLQAIFGKNFENVRAQGGAVRESTTGTLGRAGMLGTGTEMKMAKENAWSNENLVTEAMRDLLITGEAKKSSDIALANQLFQSVSGADVQQQAMGQGQGPALTEMLMTALLMGKMGKQKSAIGDDPEQIIRNIFGIAGNSSPTSYQWAGTNPVPISGMGGQ